MTEKQRRHVWEVLPIFLIAAILITYLVLSAFHYSRWRQTVDELDAGWTISGEPVGALPDSDIRTAGETTVLENTLNADFDEAQTLCFYTVYETVRVELDGREIYSFDKPSGERIASAAPSLWNTVALPGGCAGSVLRVVLSCPYQLYANRIPEFRYGSSRSIYRYVTMKTVPPFVGALAVLLIGLIFSIVALILRYHLDENTGLYSFSLFVVVLALFLASQQTTILMSLYGESSHIVLQNVSFMLCPVMYTRYLMRSTQGAKKRIALGLNIISIFNCAVILLFQLIGLKDMPEMMSSTRNLCVIVAAYMFILELNQQRRILICMFALAVLYSIMYYYITGAVSWVVYASIYVYLYMMVYRVLAGALRTKAKEIRLEAALEVSRSEIATIQITSHFFYHTLDSIRALIRLDADKAYKMTGDFAKYVRYRVDGVERLQETVPFSRELRSIRAYTDIKQAQLGERFEMLFDVETEDFEILPLAVQPLVENAVIHAVQKRREGGRVCLICRETDKGYHIEVIDNGPGGALPEALTEEQAKSVAIKNVNTRLEFYGIAPLRFEKNGEGGMTVSLEIPKSLKRREQGA